MASAPSPVLVLGATGTTGRRVVTELHRLGVPVRAASRRSAAGAESVRFDWDDPGTHDAALDGVGAIYLLANPADADPAARMAPFVDRAVSAGVPRLVLHSAAAVDRGAPGLGQVHHAVAEAGVEWAVLRPSWFMQNLWNPGHPVGAAVRAGRDIVTATGRARIGFVDATDIARVAARVLTDRVAADRELILTGPKAISYDEVAAKLSRHLGRTVRHRSTDAGEAAEVLVAGGIRPAIAQLLAGLDEAIAAGAEDRTTDTVLECTGAPPRSLDTVLTTDDPFREENS